MNHDIYIFGSTCRGEFHASSDIDVLLIPFEYKDLEHPDDWSVYSPELIKEYYSLGRLFAWHLHLEAKCIFYSQQKPFLIELGSPAPYSTMSNDINDLEILLQQALNELKVNTPNIIYELGIVYTALRDLAMSASWVLLKKPCFSSRAPYEIPIKLPLKYRTYQQIMLARHSSTRGVEVSYDLDSVVNEIINAPFSDWINSLRINT